MSWFRLYQEDAEFALMVAAIFQIRSLFAKKHQDSWSLKDGAGRKLEISYTCQAGYLPLATVGGLPANPDYLP